MKVLVVHRQASIADHIKDQLPQCIVTCVTCGWVGLSETRTKHYDLVISSYDLPVVTGFEMVRSLRMFSINMQVPVIMLTDGYENLGYTKLAGRLNASMLTLKEVQKMKYTELWLN
jgi:DNA-binding response OmpR family regulator